MCEERDSSRRPAGIGGSSRLSTVGVPFVVPPFGSLSVHPVHVECSQSVSGLSAIFSGPLTDATAFATLLTVESLLFATLGLANALVGESRRDFMVSPQRLGAWVAALLSAVALCAVLMWTSVFGENWPCDARGAIVALVLLGAILAQPVFAVMVALALRRKSGGLPSRGGST